MFYQRGGSFVKKSKFIKCNAFANGFVAWACVSSRGKTEIQIIDKGTKVNIKYYED
jgi:hypothetical protein